ncbi:MAG: carboxylesterase family protein [Devosia sp.]|nr:carboxylesterase family protein [Devosia sp.]
MTIVETGSGRVQGIGRGGVATFLGISYAAPITPARRFLAPQPVKPWAGVRDATRLSPICPQIPTYGPVGHGAASALVAGEDFLTVNVRTPSLSGKAPVLFWIHGGGYAVGSANEPVLQSGAFAASGIVEVTVNYRLGVLGFLHLEGAANRGMLDIIQALRWVRDNIAQFGGDPNRVTLAGRSAGGFAVATLMAMPEAKGLFARAMPQSGASTAVLSVADALKTTHRYLARLGTDEAGLIAGPPVKAMLEAQRDICDQSYTQHDFARDGAAAMLGVPLVPVIEGESLPDHPEVAALTGRAAQVPMMIGCTTAEYLTHATAQPQEMDYATAARLLDPRVRPIGLSGEEIVARYRRALPQHSPIGIWRAVGGDLVFQNPASRFAAAHARFQPVVKYLFGAIEPNELGAPHGAEVGAVWYRPGLDQSERPARQIVHEPSFAAGVHAVWASFIAGATVLPGNRLWPRFDPVNPQVARLDGGRFAVMSDTFFERLTLWGTPTSEPPER